MFDFMRRFQERRLGAALQGVSTCFFDCLLSNGYVINQYVYERRLHVARRRLMQVVLSNKAGLALQAALLEVTQLRYRVSDFSEFELCSVELRALYDALSACFLTLGRRGDLEEALQWLETAMQQFEGIGEHVLKVSARDPLVYTLFLGGVDELRLALNQTQDAA